MESDGCVTSATGCLEGERGVTDPCLLVNNLLLIKGITVTLSNKMLCCKKLSHFSFHNSRLETALLQWYYTSQLALAAF